MMMDQTFRPRGFPTEGHSYASLEQCAMSARTTLGITTHNFDGLRLFERLGRCCLTSGTKRWSLDYAVSPLPPTVAAIAFYDDEEDSMVLGLSEETYAALQRGNARAKFSVLHELMHAVLHTKLLVQLSRVPHRKAALQRGAATHAPYEDTEWQADSGAAAFLMPAQQLALVEEREGPGGLTAAAIAEEFGTSLMAADVRLGVYRRFRPQLLAAAQRANGPYERTSR